MSLTFSLKTLVFFAPSINPFIYPSVHICHLKVSKFAYLSLEQILFINVFTMNFLLPIYLSPPPPVGRDGVPVCVHYLKGQCATIVFAMDCSFDRECKEDPG